MYFLILSSIFLELSLYCPFVFLSVLQFWGTAIHKWLPVYWSSLQVCLICPFTEFLILMIAFFISRSSTWFFFKLIWSFLGSIFFFSHIFNFLSLIIKMFISHYLFGSSIIWNLRSIIQLLVLLTNSYSWQNFFLLSFIFRRSLFIGIMCNMGWVFAL